MDYRVERFYTSTSILGHLFHPSPGLMLDSMYINLSVPCTKKHHVL
jgi:hypothetical protein